MTGKRAFCAFDLRPRRVVYELEFRFDYFRYNIVCCFVDLFHLISNGMPRIIPTDRC